MKVLFAVNNDDISNAIIKKYQKEYKEILAYKNVYYFNAILKELQKDKTYDRIVISEDLEPFANNNYDAIDKFLFDRLDNISDEAINENGKDADIIIICTDRRNISDDMLLKLFGIGIYNAIVGQDRSINEVCRLIHKPRSKKEAKLYYRIESENVKYKTENENNVSETEVKNILAHYNRLGRNEDKYVESFNNIVAQYNDNQLKIIINCLPIGVKAVLEEKSPKYQQLVGLQSAGVNKATNSSADRNIMVSMINSESEKKNMKKPIVIPSAVNKKSVRQLINKPEPKEEIVKPEEIEEVEDIEEDDDILNSLNNSVNELEEITNNNDIEEETNEIEDPSKEDEFEGFDFDEEEEEEETEAPEIEIEEPEVEEPQNSLQKRGRGRPRKIVPESELMENKPKRGRGRPRKVLPGTPVVSDETEDSLDLSSLDNDDNKTDDVDLFSLDNNNENENEEDNDLDLFNLDNTEEKQEDEDDEELDLFNLDDDEEDEEDEEDVDLFNLDDNEEEQEDDEEDDVDLFNLDDNKEDEDDEEDVDLFNLDDNKEQEDDEEDVDLFNLDDNNEEQEDDEEDVDLFNLDNNKEDEDDDLDLFNLDEDKEEQEEEDLLNFVNNPIEEQNDENEDADMFNLDNSEDEPAEDVSEKVNIIKPRPINSSMKSTIDERKTDLEETTFRPQSQDYKSLLTKDKKVVSFVGTTKSGTSFVVNNVAQILSARNIKTAILDLTKTRNAYYIYTNSDDRLIEKAKTCIGNLKNGIAQGIVINSNLDVYTSVPEDDADFSRVDEILETLIKNYSVVLIDCDFDTPMEYFDRSQETYLVQSMDVLTMQPLTAFLRNLQSKDVLKPEKLRIVINKGVKIKSVSIKALIGGISTYNDPSMTYMKELFNKDNINYCVIPFEIQNYIKYLDSVITCSVTLNGYTKPLIGALNELGNMIYPVINNNKTYAPMGNSHQDNFSDQMNDTLNKMKKYQ